jgi:hypothetical protein
MMIGYEDDHSPNTYKVVKQDAGAQVVLTQNMRWEHWEHPTKSKLKSQLAPEKKTMLENIVPIAPPHPISFGWIMGDSIDLKGSFVC